MNKINIEKFGLTDKLKKEASLYKGFYIGRVLSQYKDLYQVVCENGEIISEISGKFRFRVKTLSDFPAVGDFVMLDRNTNRNGNAIIHHILSRKNAFIRKAAGTSNDEQIVASNIDTIFICMSLNNDFNLRRLERYLSIAWDSNAIPVVILTKSDLCDNLEQYLYEINSVAIGVDIFTTSAIHENSYFQLKQYIKENETVAFIGSSGVGKSTLINCLIGENKLNTNGLRNDDKGKHTTTRRELILLENGGMVIDTPGMRELGLESADLAKTFSDIERLASMCKFYDCTHTNEPSCAIQEAIQNGILSTDRFLNYQKLKKEAKYEGLNSRQIESIKMKDMFGSIGGVKNFKKFVKEKSKRR